jgi:hypothetical protein
MGLGACGSHSSSVFDKAYNRNVTVNNNITIKNKIPNPDPKNYRILLSEKIEDYLIVKIKYPDCTNYEGIKILIFKDIEIKDLIGQGIIDPHFSDNEEFYSPVARFVPTDEGMKMARKFCRAMMEGRYI